MKANSVSECVANESTGLPCQSPDYLDQLRHIMNLIGMTSDSYQPQRQFEKLSLLRRCNLKEGNSTTLKSDKVPVYNRL